MHGGGAGTGDAGELLGEFDNAIAKQKWLGLYPEVLEKTDRIDFVVNSAGVLPRGPLRDTSEETVYASTEVNYLAPVFIA